MHYDHETLSVYIVYCLVYIWHTAVVVVQYLMSVSIVYLGAHCTWSSLILERLKSHAYFVTYSMKGQSAIMMPNSVLGSYHLVCRRHTLHFVIYLLICTGQKGCL